MFVYSTYIAIQLLSASILSMFTVSVRLLMLSVFQLSHDNFNRQCGLECMLLVH